MLTAKQSFFSFMVYLRVDVTTFTHIVTIDRANFLKISTKYFLLINSLKLKSAKSGIVR